MSNKKHYTVRAVSCDHTASDDLVYQSLKKATEGLSGSWQRLQAAGTIAIKFNQDKAPGRVVMYDDRNRQQLVSDSVARAVLRLLREKTTARLICVDCSAYVLLSDENPRTTTSIEPLLKEFDVDYADGTAPPFSWIDTPGGGLMFGKYQMMDAAIQADEMVDVGSIKNHGFMGVSGCLKNLFGLVPHEHHGGRPRSYYHHLVRMPYLLPDLGRIFDPALNIIDALAGQAGSEWGWDDDPGRAVDGLIAGDQVVATDACTAHLMGHDPSADWRTPPFHRDRNPLLVAAQSGFGTVDLDQIDFVSDVPVQGPGTFYAVQTDSNWTNYSWRKTMCEQALFYRDHRKQFVDRHAGEFILIQKNEVRWHDTSGTINVSRRKLAGENPGQAMWLKYVDPDEAEGEHYEVYEDALRNLGTAPPKD